MKSDMDTLASKTLGDRSTIQGLSENLIAPEFLHIEEQVPEMVGAVMTQRLDFHEVVDDSWKVFANVRDQRFNEMEYTVPADVGPQCLREILKTIRKQNLNSFFPIEYRYIKADNIPLSMFSGRDGCAISVHQSYELDYHNFFAAIEPIFWKYEGRPHWGKLHTLNATQLARVYPQWGDFLALRQELDPRGKFMIAHLQSVFGVAPGC